MDDQKNVEANEKPMTAYYYQLQAEFYQRREVKILEKMQNGLAYAYFYLKLCVESLATNGYLRMNNLPLSVDDLAAITDIHVDTVRSAVAVLMKMGMIQQVDDGAYYLEEVTKFLKRISMTPEAIRKRRQRQREAEEAARLKAAEEEAGRLMDGLTGTQCPDIVPDESESVTKCHDDVTNASQGTVTNSHKSVTNSHKTVTKCHESIEYRDYSLDNLEEEETTKYSYCESRAHAPTREEVKEFISEQCPHVNPDGFFKYYQKTNWTQNGEPIRDWRRMAVTWEEQLTAECQTLPMEEERKLWKEYEKKFGKKVSPAYFGIRYKYVQLAIATGVPLEE